MIKMSNPQNLAKEFINQVRGQNLSKDKLTELLAIVNGQYDKLVSVQKMVEKEGRDHLSYELFIKAMSLASGGKKVPIEKDEWAFLMPDQKEQLKRDLLATSNEMIKAFDDVKDEITKELSKFDNSASSNNSGGGCFIATEIYGSYDSAPVLILRQFRDEKLLTNKTGSILVKYYYFISPQIVKLMSNKNVLNKIIKSILDRFVNKLN